MGYYIALGMGLNRWEICTMFHNGFLSVCGTEPVWISVCTGIEKTDDLPL